MKLNSLFNDTAEKRHCDNCKAVMAKAHRIDAGQAFCSKCYQREFKIRSCSHCDVQIKAHWRTIDPLCRNCAAVDRACIRCQRPMTKIGRLIAGKPVCPSCAPNFAEARACADCGRESKRVRLSESSGALVCDRCQDNIDFATCARCRRHRKVQDYDPSGRPLCAACASALPSVYPCPECGADVPGRGRAPCATCSLKNRVRRRFAYYRPVLENLSIAVLFDEFSLWGEAQLKNGNAVARIDRYADFFITLDRHFEDHDAITQERLLAIFGLENLRRCSFPLRFLCEKKNLEWRTSIDAEFVEGLRLGTIMQECESQPWGKDAFDYVRYLRNSKQIKLRTVRGYARVAVDLLTSSGVSSVESLDQEDLDRYLRSKRGQASNITSFRTWLELTNKSRLTVKLRKGDPIRAEKALIKSLSDLVTRLRSTDSQPEGRALFCYVVSKAFGLPLTTVLGLRREEAILASESTQIAIGEMRITIESVLHEAFLKFADLQGPLLFPGRNARRPMTDSAARYFLHPQPRGEIR